MEKSTKEILFELLEASIEKDEKHFESCFKQLEEKAKRAGVNLHESQMGEDILRAAAIIRTASLRLG